MPTQSKETEGLTMQSAELIDREIVRQINEDAISISGNISHAKLLYDVLNMIGNNVDEKDTLHHAVKVGAYASRVIQRILDQEGK